MSQVSSLGQRVRQLRKSAGLSQHELARRARISQPRVSQIEHDDILGRLPTRTLQDLAEGLGVDLEALIGSDSGYDPSEFEGLGAIGLPDAGLPIPTTPLIGRHSELTEAKSLLLDAEVQLLTVTGPVGVGKSLLALHCVQNLESRYPDGVFIVSLSSCRNAAEVVSTIAHAVGVRQRDELPLRTRLIVELAASQRLLLLDNVEQALGPVAAFATEVLGAGSKPGLLITSRAPLGIRNEHEFALEPLGLPDPSVEPTPSTVAASPAVQLFVRRAHAVSPRFSLTQSNAPLLAEICRRLDGLPLAIELAAARTKVFTLAQILNRLDEPLAFLATGNRDMPPRQQGLRSAIAWSYDLLGPEEKTLFRRVSTFAGGFALEAAEWMMADHSFGGEQRSLVTNGHSGPSNDSGSYSVTEGIKCLLDQSLLMRLDHPDGSNRFRMLETIRGFAAEQLFQVGDAAEAFRRHLTWCLTMAESADSYPFNSQQPRWLRRLDQERENFLAALSWALNHGEYEAGARLCIALTDYWYIFGHLSEGRAWLDRTLELLPEDAQDTDRLVLRIWMLACASQLAQPNGELQMATVRAEESRRLARELNHLPGIARAAAHQGNIALVGGEYDKAESFHREALELFRRLENPSLVAAALNNLALVSLSRGEHDAALTYAIEAIQIAQEIGDGWGTGIALLVLGDVALFKQQFGSTAQFFEESLKIAKTSGSRWAISDALAAFGSLAIQHGEVERGVRFLGVATAMYERIGLKLPPRRRTDWRNLVQWAEALLGGQRFHGAWGIGLRTDAQTAIAEALEYGCQMQR